MHPHLAGDMSEYYMAIFQLYPEGGIGEVFKYLTLHLNYVVFRHDPRSAKRHVIAALEIRLAKQRFILLRHHIRLHLRHEVHRHHHDNQQ